MRFNKNQRNIVLGTKDYTLLCFSRYIRNKNKEKNSLDFGSSVRSSEIQGVISMIYKSYIPFYKISTLGSIVHKYFK